MAPKHFAPVWQYYERHEPTGRSKHHRAICKFCSYELSGQPERMKTHLQRCGSCPQNIKEEFSQEENSSSNNFAISMSAMEFERNEEETYRRAAGQAEPPLKRRRSIEVGSGAEGLAGLPWAPTANASAIVAAPAAVPPGFQQVYAAPAAPAAVTPAGTVGPNTGAAGAATNTGRFDAPFSHVYEKVRGYYSRVTPMGKMQTSIGPTVSPHPLIREAIGRVPKPVRDRFYGCGVPLPPGIEGLRVLDLGCGAGRDCYVAAQLVGRTGEVIGVDMTDEQLRVAREFVAEYGRTLGYQPHLRFVKGYIEFLSQVPELYGGSIDLCISNNAVNLSPNKELVLRSVFEVLKEGGEFQFSDIYADRRLPNHVRTHPVLMGECLGGALYTEDFKRLCQRVGFMDARQVSAPAPVRIESPELRDLVGATQFYSITFRLFKFARPASVLEPTREDYGQVAVYRGTIDGQRARTRLDSQWAFEANRPVLVDGNTAVILAESWLRRHFEVRGDRSLHFGAFAHPPPQVQYEPWETDHEYEEYDSQTQGLGSDEPVVRRRGIRPLPTPYFLNGLRQQQQQQQQQQDGRSQSASRRGSPVYEQRPPISPQSSMPLPPAGKPRSSLREAHAAFPRLSSFSISQSNVRAENAGLRSTAAQPAISVSPAAIPSEPSMDPRFVLPATRIAPAYKPSPISSSSSPMRFSSSQQQQQMLSASSSHSAGQQQQMASSPSIRSGSTASPVATQPASAQYSAPPPPRHQLHPPQSAPYSSAPSTCTRSQMSPTPPPRQHSPQQSVAATASSIS